MSAATGQSPHNSRKTTWFPHNRKMRPLPATASQEKSHVPSRSAKRYLASLMRHQKFPDTLVSLEGNTEAPGTTSSEPLLPS